MEIDDDEDDEYGNEGGAPNEGGGGNDEEGENLANYKGIYYNDDQGQKYTDPENGAHFEYRDMCRRLQKAMVQRDAYEKQWDKEAALLGGSQ